MNEKKIIKQKKNLHGVFADFFSFATLGLEGENENTIPPTFKWISEQNFSS